MTREAGRALRRYALFLALAAVAAAALVAVGWWPTRRWAGEAGTVALVAGCAIAWLGSAVGGLPVMMADTLQRSTVGLVLSASALRPVAVLAVAAAVALSGRLPVAPLLVWAALGHLVLLVVDTLYAAGVNGARVPIFGPGADGGKPAAAGDGGHGEATAKGGTQRRRPAADG